MLFMGAVLLFLRLLSPPVLVPRAVVISVPFMAFLFLPLSLLPVLLLGTSPFLLTVGAAG
jgi:hypothetical protein